MAATASSFPPIIASVRTSASPKMTSPSPLPPLTLPSLITSTSRASSGHARSAEFVRAKKELAREEKRELLERYGLDPDEFLSDSAPKTRRRKEATGKGTGEEEERDSKWMMIQEKTTKSKR